jgi:hypothetical protein
MRALALCCLMLLAGCAYFRSPPDYRRTAAGSEVASSDLEACRQQARAMIQRDRQIDNDISTPDINDSHLRSDTTLETNLAQYHESNRYESIVQDCMSSRGYNTDGQ